jgi:cystathionine gamma-synthase
MDLDPETRLALAGPDADDPHSRVVPPLDQPARPRPEDDGRAPGRAPARKALEDTLADLDGGAGAVACATGKAALSTVASLFDADAHLLCAHGCRGKTEPLFSFLAEQGKLSVSYADASDRSALADAVRPETEALWVETPSPPLLHVVDLEALSRFADAHDLLLIVDNTLLSPLLQRPLDHGADLVVYSSTTLLSGQPDGRGGAVGAASEALADRLTAAADAHGTGAAPFDGELVLRGVKTLSVRMQRHETNARCVAHALHEHPAVERVCYPGLRHHPGHEVARRQQDGYGGVIAFFVDDRVDVEALLGSTEVFALGASGGGVASRIERPATMSRASMAPAQRAEAGITDALLRLSVGIESADDLTADLEKALDAAQPPAPEATPAPFSLDAGA